MSATSESSKDSIVTESTEAGPALVPLGRTQLPPRMAERVNVEILAILSGDGPEHDFQGVGRASYPIPIFAAAGGVGKTVLVVVGTRHGNFDALDRTVVSQTFTNFKITRQHSCVFMSWTPDFNSAFDVSDFDVAVGPGGQDTAPLVDVSIADVSLVGDRIKFPCEHVLGVLKLTLNVDRPSVNQWALHHYWSKKLMLTSVVRDGASVYLSVLPQLPSLITPHGEKAFVYDASLVYFEVITAGRPRVHPSHHRVASKRTRPCKPAAPGRRIRRRSRLLLITPAHSGDAQSSPTPEVASAAESLPAPPPAPAPLAIGTPDLYCRESLDVDSPPLTPPPDAQLVDEGSPGSSPPRQFTLTTPPTRPLPLPSARALRAHLHEPTWSSGALTLNDVFAFWTGPPPSPSSPSAASWASELASSQPDPLAGLMPGSPLQLRSVGSGAAAVHE